jgi:ferrous iron transport protein B
MPNYKLPLPKNVAYTVLEKTKSFVLGAGKIILAISIILWFLGSFGISSNFKNAEQIVEQRIERDGFSAFNQSDVETKLALYQQELNDNITKNAYQLDKVDFTDAIENKKTELFKAAKSQEIASFKLENSFMGYAGKVIEPLVKPLGYDWKIGIAVLTSFAAREVFVGTLATIYSVGSGEENTDTITQRMAAEVNPKTQKPVFNLATGISILLFYAFAMQCMSTLAIVKRETNSWKWPAGQLVFMSLFAYIVALIAYQLLK